MEEKNPSSSQGKSFQEINLYRPFRLEKDDYDLLKIFLTSKFTSSTSLIESQKDKIIKLLTNKRFIYEYDILLFSYLEEDIPDTDAENKKIANLIKYGNVLFILRNQYSEKNTCDKTCIQILIQLIKNTELLGDLVIHDVVESIVHHIKDKYNDKICEDKLRSFLNSNVGLYNIIKTITNLDIREFFPIDFDYRIRLAKRAETKRFEIFNTDCIDYKYYANLFEQIMGYLFIKKGLDFSVERFLKILAISGFNVEDFMKNCISPKSRPYDGLVLKPGCSCKNDWGDRICDNPKKYDPKYFKNNPCPLECHPNDLQFFITSNTDTQIEFVNELSSKELNNLLSSIPNYPLDFFMKYIFNWRKDTNDIYDIYLYPILEFISIYNIPVSKNVLDFINQLRSDILVFQKMIDNIIDAPDREYDLKYYSSDKLNFPSGLAILKEYPYLLENDNNYNKIFKLYNDTITKYRNILGIQPRFSIGVNPTDRKTTSRRVSKR